ncbi:MAG: DUF4198 domain-containing protein [Acidovorax sp.]
MFKTLCALGLAAIAATGHAHQIWIEQPAGEPPVLRFGEFAENLREASPGLLDVFGKPTAVLVAGQAATSVPLAKGPSGFTLAARPAPGEALVAEDAAFPLRKTADAMSWYRPGARHATGWAAQPGRLALDIVPGGSSGAVQVFYQGQPLPKAKVAIAVPSGWGREAVTDAQGRARFDLPWQGDYVIEVSHIDCTPGEREGQRYDNIHYVTTLHVTQTEGLPPIPAGPPAKPH